MLGSAFWPGFVLLVVALPGDVVHIVLVAGWVMVAGVFVVRAAHLLRPAAGRTTGETVPRSGSDPRVLRALISADAGGPPTSFVSADPSRAREAA